MTVRMFNQVGLTLRDLEESLRLRRDLLGFRLLGRGTVDWEHLNRIVGLTGTQIELAELKVPGPALLELFAYSRPVGAPLPDGGMNRPGMTHICLEVDDIQGPVARLTAAGYRPRSRGIVTILRGPTAAASASTSLILTA
jgi:catechol 2,3-dioxygenase-like lactoylglutathione lyase family enzyme